MYTTLTFKNGIHADVLKDEVVAWLYDWDFKQELVCRREYKNDDDLLVILEEIKKRVNSDNHVEVWDFFFTEFNAEDVSITYAENGSLIVKANGSYSAAEYFSMLEKLEEIKGVSVEWKNSSSMIMSLSKSVPVYHMGYQVATIFY